MFTTVEEGPCAIFTGSELTKIPGSNASRSALVDGTGCDGGQGSFDPSPERACGPVSLRLCLQGDMALADQVPGVHKLAKEKHAEMQRPDYLSLMYRGKVYDSSRQERRCRTIASLDKCEWI